MNFGIDVSHHNGHLDWKKIKAAGVDFAYLKASEGIFMRDQLFIENAKNAKLAGVLVGAYHFFRPARIAKHQAQNFLAMINNVDLDLPHCLDWEVDDEQTPKTCIEGAQVWLDAVEVETQKKPIIYTGPAFFDSMGNPEQFAKYKLWIAHYTKKKVRVPRPWADWTIHQFTEEGELKDVKGHFDFNYCELEKLKL